jgi:hypothetical protein
MKSTVIKNLLTFGCILAFGQLGLPQSARASSADLNLSITVHVFNYAELSPKALQHAEAVAAQIYREAGIEAAWLDCSPLPPQAQNLPACPGTLGPTEFALRIHFRNRAAQAGFPESWLDYAMPPAEEGGRSSQASVFFDRVLEQANNGNASVPVALGHAMAQELEHLLMPSVGHTASGLMRGKWSPRDLLLAAQGKLHFTSQQAEIIRTEVSTRNRMQQAEALPGMSARN